MRSVLFSLLLLACDVPQTAPRATEAVEEEALMPMPDDRDADGLTDAEERVLGTNPAHPDSDGDGLFDGREVAVSRASWGPIPSTQTQMETASQTDRKRRS